MPRIWVKSLFDYFTLSLPLSVESFRKVIAKLHRAREQFQDRFVSLSNPNRGNEHHLLTIDWRDERRWKRIRNRCRLLAAANRAKNRQRLFNWTLALWGSVKFRGTHYVPWIPCTCPGETGSVYFQSRASTTSGNSLYQRRTIRKQTPSSIYRVNIYQPLTRSFVLNSSSDSNDCYTLNHR